MVAPTYILYLGTISSQCGTWIFSNRDELNEIEVLLGMEGVD